MIKNILFVLLISIFSIYGLVAQENNHKGKIHLKDGTVLVGKVLEDNDFHVKLIIETGDTLTIGYKSIIVDYADQPRHVALAERTYSDEKYFLTIGVKAHIDDQSNSELFGILGKRINDHINIGLNISYLVRDNFSSNFFLQHDVLNVGVYGRYYIKTLKPRIFADASLGYGFVIKENQFGQIIQENDISAGLQGSVSAGIHFASRKRLRWIFNFGVTFNQLSGDVVFFDPFNGEVRSVFSNKYVMPFLGVGIEF